VVRHSSSQGANTAKSDGTIMAGVSAGSCGQDMGVTGAGEGVCCTSGMLPPGMGWWQDGTQGLAQPAVRDLQAKTQSQINWCVCELSNFLL
jgi:hypothetical protein